ncbi:Armadillo repeat-containing protein 2, variant 2 [Chamberlinius hualienensis]
MNGMTNTFNSSISKDCYLDHLIRFVEIMEPIEDWEALTYTMGALKLLSTNFNFLQKLSKAGAVSAMASHLQNIVQIERSEEDKFGHILFHLTGGLRNMADISSNRHQFIQSNALSLITKLLSGPYSHDVDIILTASKILSKLTMYYEICTSLTESSEDFFNSANDLLLSMKHDNEITLRLCFALGNITAKNEQARQILFHKANVVPTLLPLIDDSSASKCPIQTKTELYQFCKQDDYSETSLGEEIQIKVIRLLANMSISPQVGPLIANNSEIFDRLIDRVAVKNEEICLSSLAALSNLTYYLVQNQLFTSTNLHNSIKFITEQLNSSSNQLLLGECLRLATNISHGKDPRKLLSQNKVGTIVIRLMQEDDLNREILYLCCGLLINIVAEETARNDIRQENGVKCFIQKFSKSADEGDWQVAGMLCQILWNYLSYTTYSHQNTNQYLVSLLDHHLSRPATTDHDLWKLEFYPVAWRLLARVKGKD